MQTRRRSRLLFSPVSPALPARSAYSRFLFPLLQQSRTTGISKKATLPLPHLSSQTSENHHHPFHFWIATKKIILPQPTSTRALSISLLPPRYVISPTPLPTIVPLHCSAPMNECAIRRHQPLPPPAHPPPPALNSPADLPKLAPPTDLPTPALPPLAA